MDPRTKTAQVKVVCPFSDGKPYTVYVPYMLGDDGKPAIWMSNGCDHMSGSPVCVRCAAFVHAHFNNPELVSDDANGLFIVK